MSPSAREYLQHILDETTYIINNSVELDKASFLQDETLKQAYVRSIEVIGEAVKQLLMDCVKNTVLLNGEQWLGCAIA